MLHSQLALPDTFEACYLEYNRVFPLETTATHVRVAVSTDPDPDVIAQLEREFARPVELVSVPDEELVDAIRSTYAAAESILEVVNDLRSDSEQHGYYLGTRFSSNSSSCAGDFAPFSMGQAFAHELAHRFPFTGDGQMNSEAAAIETGENRYLDGRNRIARCNHLFAY